MGRRKSETDLRRLLDKLFVLTDAKAWEELRTLFVNDTMIVDMSSLAGGGPVEMTADELIAGFTAGLHADKISHHMATNMQVVLRDTRAEVTAQGYAWNLVTTLPAGKDFWETWGSYRLTCQQVGKKWRIDGFSYFSKHTRGPDAVRTHTVKP